MSLLQVNPEGKVFHQLLRVSSFMTVGMITFQALKRLLFPRITLFQSNVATVVVVSLLGSLAAYFLIKRYRLLMIQAQKEVAQRRKAEEELQATQLELELLVKKRTRALLDSTSQLTVEIKERQKYEDAYKTSEEKYRHLLEAAPISITSFDEKGRVDFINDFHLTHFAARRHDADFFLGRRIWELPGPVSAGLGQELEGVLNGATVEKQGVFCEAFSGGHPGFMNLRAVPLIKEERVVGGILIREDVTSQFNAEMELRRTNRALDTVRACNHALIRAMTETDLLNALCRTIVDIGGYLLAWVGFAVRDEEKSIDPVAVAGLDDGYLNRTKPTWSEAPSGLGPAGKAIRSGRTVVIKDIEKTAEYPVWQAEARKRKFVSAIGLPLILDGTPMGALSILSGEDTFDPVEISLLEELAEDLAYGLAVLRIRAERNKQAEEMRRLETQLRQAQKLEAIGTLAGGIAHDFNNILSVIYGFAQLTRMGLPEDQPAFRNLEQVLIAADRAKELIRQILTFSRRTDQEFRPIEITPIIKETVRFLRSSLPVSIEIHHDVSSTTDIVLADPTQIHQVLINLGANAAHAMSEKGGALDIRMDQVEKLPLSLRQGRSPHPAGFLKLSVSDTGHGMDSKTMARIFEPYFTTKQPTEGTGLGLAVVHGIVENHGGAIQVSSQPGQGTTFDIYLPRFTGRTPTTGGPVDNILPGGTERILFVDDEEALALFAENFLTHLGYRITTETSSPKALELFKADPHDYDLVITDYTMPQMTGMEMAAAMLKIRPDLPIILCTGFNRLVSAEKAMDAGIVKFVMKPFVVKEMAQGIRSVLEHRKNGSHYGVLIGNRPTTK